MSEMSPNLQRWMAQEERHQNNLWGLLIKRLFDCWDSLEITFSCPNPTPFCFLYSNEFLAIHSTNPPPFPRIHNKLKQQPNTAANPKPLQSLAEYFTWNIRTSTLLLLYLPWSLHRLQLLHAPCATPVPRHSGRCTCTRQCPRSGSY